MDKSQATPVIGQNLSNLRLEESKGDNEMRQKTLFDRGFTLTLALILVGGILAMQQMRLQSGVSSASNGSLAADASPQVGIGYISVPPAAFQPEIEGYNYTNTGNALYMNSGSGIFIAPLQLPHGATVTKVKLNFYDGNVSANIFLYLIRSASGSFNLMATILSNDNGLDSVETTLIEESGIDNETYSYYLQAAIGSGSIYLCDVIIEFTYPTTFLPLVMRDH